MTERFTQVVQHFSCVDMRELVLPQIVVYQHTSDYPEGFVARLWDAAICSPTNVVALADGLEEIRAKIPETFVLIMRDPTDDPTIVEVWT